MGVLLPCHLSCHRDEEYFQSSSNSLHSESSSSISSQPSLPSIPSLQYSSSQKQEKIHHKCISTLQGNSYVFSIAITGQFVYAGGSNGEIRAWTSEGCSNNYVVAVTGSAVKSLLVLGDKLFSSHQDCKIRVWKIQNNLQPIKYKCVATLPTLNDRFLRCFLEKNYVKVRRHVKSTWVHHVDAVSALAVSEDGGLLYSASWDRSFKVWRTFDFKCLESVQNAHDDAINAVAVSKDGFVYTGSADKTIKAWRKRGADAKHLVVATMEKHKSAVNALALSNDGSVLYSGACDRSILVWERENNGDDTSRHMVLIGALRGHTRAILCLAIAKDLVCSGSADKTVRIWRRGTDRSYRCLAVLEGHRRPVKCLSAAVDSNVNAESDSESCTTCTVCSGGMDYDIKIWQVLASVF